MDENNKVHKLRNIVLKKIKNNKEIDYCRLSNQTKRSYREEKRIKANLIYNHY